MERLAVDINFIPLFGIFSVENVFVRLLRLIRFEIFSSCRMVQLVYWSLTCFGNLLSHGIAIVLWPYCWSVIEWRIWCFFSCPSTCHFVSRGIDVLRVFSIFSWHCCPYLYLVSSSTCSLGVVVVDGVFTDRRLVSGDHEADTFTVSQTYSKET